MKGGGGGVEKEGGKDNKLGGGERVGGMEWMTERWSNELEGGEREEEEKGRERWKDINGG